MLLLGACARGDGSTARTDSSAVPTSVSAYASRSAGAARALAPTNDADRQEIVRAVRSAYGLDSIYMVQYGLEDGPHLSGDGATAFWRQGFADSLFQFYSMYRSQGGAEWPMAVPDSVSVIRADSLTAEVWYPTPPLMREIWGREAYTIDRLRRVEGRWVVVSSRPQAARPEGR